MGSYKDIENLMENVTPEMLVGDGKKNPKQLGEATYRFIQLSLLAQIAKALDTIAFNHNQLAQAAGSSNGIMKGLAKTYADMLAIQQQRKAAPPTGAPGAKPNDQ